jgi:DNA-binding NarL/FixJ family response regulator
VRCLIVDDNAGFVAAARRLLQAEGLTVVGSASSGAEALDLVAQLHPDVTLVDIDLGTESGLDVVDTLERAGLPTPVILISAHSQDDFADPIAQSGAVGFVAKSQLSAATVRAALGASAGLEESDHR